MSYYIGVMSGTSLDGVDVAITQFSESTDFQFIAAKTFPFPDALYSTLSSFITEQKCHFQDLGESDIALGQLIGESINKLLISQKLSASEITAIGSHGQTLFHSPTGQYPFSTQIGNANVIAEITGITTIADFRQRDIAAGGQGAPLVPAFHHALFGSDYQDRVIVNIGGISNITLLPASSDAIIGFDTGPGKCLLDYWVQRHLDQSYDESGQWARSGQCNSEFLSLLLDETFFKQQAPKSTGRELFNQLWLEDKVAQFGKTLQAVDIQATLLELTAQTITNDINHYANKNSCVLICGGGAQNKYLLERLQILLADKKLTTSASLGLHPDWVEACAFAWLASRTINKKSGNLPSVTGAKHSAILGAIYQA